VVNDPLLQKFLQLRSSESSLKRVDDWLLAFFEDQLQNPHSAEAKILEMLQAILEYTRYSKVCFPLLMTYHQRELRFLKLIYSGNTVSLFKVPHSYASHLEWKHGSRGHPPTSIIHTTRSL
jgi:hypothetical protein